MVKRTKSAPLHNLSSAGSATGPRPTSRFPKNTARSLSPTREAARSFPANPSRASKPPKKERKENSQKAAKESLLDSASQLKKSRGRLNPVQDDAGKTPSISKTPIRKAQSWGDELERPKKDSDRSKSPLRKGRKSTGVGHRSLSRLTDISPLHKADTIPNHKSLSQLGFRGSTMQSPLDKDDSIISEPPKPSLDHWGDIPPPEAQPEEALSPESKPKDLPPSNLQKIPGSDKNNTNRPTSPKRKASKETAPRNGKNQELPKSFVVKKAAGGGNSAHLKRSMSGDDVGGPRHGNNAKAPLRRAMSHQGGKRMERGQKPNSESNTLGRKPSLVRRNKPPAESLLNHPLLGDSHSNQLDLSVSVSEVNATATAADTANPTASAAPNHQRRQAGSIDEKSERNSNIPESSSRNSMSSASGRKGRSPVPTKHIKKPLRKCKSSPEGSKSSQRVDSPSEQRNHRGASRPKHGEEKKGNSSEIRRSKGSLERKGENSERRRGSVIARRAGSRARTEEAKNKAPLESIEGVKETLKKATGDKRAISHSPARPRARAAGASFPSNGTRSVSPSRGRSRRGASPTPGSRHRRTIVPGDSSAHPRTESSSQSRSPNSTQRELRRQRDTQEIPVPATPTQRDPTQVVPPSGIQQRRPSLSLANVFDLERNQDAGGHGSDSSASNQSDAIATVVQFDPTNVGSISSFKPAPDDPSMDNSGVFRMESLKNKEELGNGSGSQRAGYLPGNMDVGLQPNAKASSPQGEGRQRRASERRQSARNRSIRERSHSRSRSRGPREKKGEEGNPRGSLRKTESLRMDQVFDLGSKSESFLEDSQLSSISSHGSSCGGSGNESNRKARRQRLRQKLKKQTGSRSDEGDSDEGSVYLPANMATPRGVSPIQSCDNENDASKELVTDMYDEHDGDEEKRRSSALSYVKKQLKNQKNQIKNDVNVLKEKVRSYRDQSKSSSMLDTGGDSVRELDPHNNKTSMKSEPKSVGKKLKGLFKGKSKSKKHSQLLGGGESDSDYSAGK